MTDRRYRASRDVKLDVADAGNDVEMSAKPDDIGPQRLQPNGVTVLDLADTRLTQPRSLSQLSLGQPELLPDLGQLGATDRSQHLLTHLLAPRHALSAVPGRIGGTGLRLDVPP